MPTIDIRGTSVAFPFNPYDCQLDYIGGVLEALNDAVCFVVFFQTLCFLKNELVVAQRTHREANRGSEAAVSLTITARSVPGTAR